MAVALWRVLIGSFVLVLVESSSAAPGAVGVVVQVYDEALCVDCQRFILEQLRPAYETLGPTVMDLRMVAFGNAHIEDPTNPDSLTCQHDQAECDANSYLQCAAALYPVTYRHFPFVACLYEQLDMGQRATPFPTTLFAACAQETALDWKLLQQCHDKDAWQWQLQAWAETMPTGHTYVPWVVLDGKHYDLEQPRTDFFSVVCEIYKATGGMHPACPVSTAAVV